MKQAIFMVAYFGADGRGRRHISFATTDEQERDQWLKDKGKNARYYSPVEEVHDLDKVALIAWNKLTGLEKLALSRTDCAIWTSKSSDISKHCR